ncbi:MAG: hypothetical protein JJE22_08020 [Bacteroidia bacterium]|nr:hypothetical protein [Bacteroidia bacterium]
MKFSIDQLSKSVLQKDTLEQCNHQELQKLVDQYPYFGAAHLLLTKKMLSENDEPDNAQVHNPSLFFQNPLWLENLLNDTGNAEIIPASPLSESEEKKQSLVEELAKLTLDIPRKKSDMIIEQPEEIKSEPEETPSDEDAETEPELPAFKMQPIDPANSKLIFEPYHTVDYFASLGIKFKEEAQPQDKFGKQLKSFTEWLKTLKKLPESEVSQTNDSIMEHQVEELAGQSIQDREIITEAMADVWIKQGNTAKAIEVYNKLSLLIASKRPYFAAKIEELKK